MFPDQKKTRVSCKECGGAMATPSLRHHMERPHGIVLPQTGGADVSRGGADTYVVSFLRVLNLVEFPVDRCPERANKPGRLR